MERRQLTMSGVCFGGEGRQFESRCSINHVRKVGQVFKGVEVCQ